MDKDQEVVKALNAIDDQLTAILALVDSPELRANPKYAKLYRLADKMGRLAYEMAGLVNPHPM